MSMEGMVGIGLSVVSIIIGILGYSHVTKSKVKVKKAGNMKAKNGSNVNISNIKIGNIENNKKSGE